MHLQQYYTELWLNAMLDFKAGSFEYDPLIKDKGDKRFGLTLLFRPPPAVQQSIEDMLAHLRKIEPRQYYYPVSDMHVTVMSIISCYDGFTKASFVDEDYIDVIKHSLRNIKPFSIQFSGITASTSCIMVQGFADGQLNLLRQHLREQFENSSLEKSLDSRYTMKLAHATVMRFHEKLKSPHHFLEELEKFRHASFGEAEIGELEFVYNDWFQRKKRCETLATFRL